MFVTSVLSLPVADFSVFSLFLFGNFLLFTCSGRSVLSVSGAHVGIRRGRGLGGVTLTPVVPTWPRAA